MKITEQWLRAHGACPDQIAIFKKEWPKGGKITRAHLERALDLGLNLEWLYDRLCFSRAAYTKAMQPVWEAYERGLATAWEGYNQAMISAEVAYTKAVRPAWEAYERGLATTQKNYGVQGLSVAKAEYKQIVTSAEATYKQMEAIAKTARAQAAAAAKAACVRAVAEALIPAVLTVINPGARMRNYSEHIRRHAYVLWQRLSSRPFLQSLKRRNR